MRSWLALGLGAFLLGACGGDGANIGGFYMVTSITTDPTGCGVGTTPTNPPAFLYATSQDFLGHTIWTVKECSAKDPTTCTSEVAGFLSESIKDGWKGVLTASSPSSTECALTYAVQTAVVTGGVMTAESTTYTQVDATPMAMCTTDEAQKRNTSMPCTNHRIATATLVK